MNVEQKERRNAFSEPDPLMTQDGVSRPLCRANETRGKKNKNKSAMTQKKEKQG